MMKSYGIESFAAAAAEDFTAAFAPDPSAVRALIDEYFAGIDVRVCENRVGWSIFLPTLPKLRWQGEGPGGEHEEEQSITVYLSAAHAGGKFTARPNGPNATLDALAAGFVVLVRERLR